MNKLIPTALIIAVFVFSSPIQAQQQNTPARGPMPFAAHDLNGDGTVTEEEFNTFRNQRRAAMASQGRPMYGAANAPAFTSFDANGDGRLTLDEFEAGRRAHMEQRQNMGYGMGRGMGQGMGPGMGYGRGQGMGPGMGYGMGPGMGPGMGYGMGPCRGMGRNKPDFSRYDTDGDGVISQSEFNQAHQAPSSQSAPQ